MNASIGCDLGDGLDDTIVAVVWRKNASANIAYIIIAFVAWYRTIANELSQMTTT